MVRIFKFIIDNYYWIFVLLALWTYVGLPDFYSLVIVLFTMAAIVLFQERPINWNATDTLVVAFMLYQLCSCIFSSYNLAIYYYGVKSQIMPMAFYFIGRNVLVADDRLLKGMKWPMMLAFVAGLILYFWSPDWYMARKVAMLAGDASKTKYFEVTRLSSFWPWSYAMGYGALYFILYFSKDVLKEKPDRAMYAYLAVAMLVMFFAQLRASIAFFFLYILFISIYGNISKKRITTLWAFVGGTALALAFWLLEFGDTKYLDYVLGRSVNSGGNIIGDRFGQFASFWNVSAFGEGLGKYGHAALMYDKPCIADCEYIRLMAELGVVGCALFFLIYFSLLSKAFFLRRFLLFECCVLLFFLVAMIGASPLENASMQPFLLWYSLGKANAVASACGTLRKLSLSRFLMWHAQEKPQ